MDEELDVEAVLFVLEEVPGRLAPYVPTPHWLRETIAQMVAGLVKRYKIDIVYEPGAGAGEVGEIIEVVARPRYYIGLEIDVSLARRARTRIELGDVVIGDLRKPPLRDRPYLIYSYLLPKPLRHVIETAPRGSVIVSLEYEVAEECRAHEVEKLEIDSLLTRHRLIVYRA